MVITITPIMDSLFSALGTAKMDKSGVLIPFNNQPVEINMFLPLSKCP